MNTKKYITENFGSLKNRLVAITGATGGIGCELCEMLAGLGAELILLCRSAEKAETLQRDIAAKFPETKVSFIPLNLEDIGSVKCATEQLKTLSPDILIHNAGAYSIPRHKCETGFENVFQINFLSPYYITRELLPSLNKKEGGRVIAVSSIAHNYSKTDPADPDFSTRRASSLVYGNAKRYLTLSLYRLFENEQKCRLSVTHPGITLTNITSHYPKIIFALIKHPMKIIFMSPKKAALNIATGIFYGCRYGEWIGPRIFDVWGLPRKRRLSTFSDSEANRVFRDAEEFYSLMSRLDKQ